MSSTPSRGRAGPSTVSEVKHLAAIRTDDRPLSLRWRRRSRASPSHRAAICLERTAISSQPKQTTKNGVHINTINLKGNVSQSFKRARACDPSSCTRHFVPYIMYVKQDPLRMKSYCSRTRARRFLLNRPTGVQRRAPLSPTTTNERMNAQHASQQCIRASSTRVERSERRARSLARGSLWDVPRRRARPRDSLVPATRRIDGIARARGCEHFGWEGKARQG